MESVSNNTSNDDVFTNRDQRVLNLLTCGRIDAFEKTGIYKRAVEGNMDFLPKRLEHLPGDHRLVLATRILQRSFESKEDTTSYIDKSFGEHFMAFTNLLILGSDPDYQSDDDEPFCFDTSGTQVETEEESPLAIDLSPVEIDSSYFSEESENEIESKESESEGSSAIESKTSESDIEESSKDEHQIENEEKIRLGAILRRKMNARVSLPTTKNKPFLVLMNSNIVRYNRCARA